MEHLALSAELESIVLKYTSDARRGKLKPTDRLDEDLRLLPEDAAALIADVFDRFSIAHGDFDFNRYFAWTGIKIPFVTNWLLKRWGVVEHQKSEPLTLSMLQRAAELKVWDSGKLREPQDT
jgi:hypothetical protein